MREKSHTAVAQAVAKGAPNALGPEMATDNTDTAHPNSDATTLPRKGSVLPVSSAVLLHLADLATHEKGTAVGKMGAHEKIEGEPHLCVIAQRLLAYLRARARGDNHFRTITGSIHRTTAADVAHSAVQDLRALFGTSGRLATPTLAGTQ